jgi:AcrR family transcriptional regulator
VNGIFGGMTSSTRRELQAQERRNQLIDAALALFAEKGLDNTTIKDLAARVGVAQGLIYHYFASKEDLLVAVIERHNFIGEMAEVFLAAGGQPIREVLHHAMLHALGLIGSHQELVRILFREALTHPELQGHVRMYQQSGIGILTGFLDARIASGELRPHDTQTTARMIAGFVFAVYATAAPAEPYITHMLDNLLGGISAS